MANMFAETQSTKKGKSKEPVTESRPAVTIEVKTESKQEGKSCGFYLSFEAIELLENFARDNRCSKSKALDTLILKVLGK